MIGTMLDNLRNEKPLVHCITNYVTANICANALLAIGSSPIMADEPEDVRDITPLCSSLNINLGTLSKRTIPSMQEAVKTARLKGIPILLDPVGAGASRFRTETALSLIDNAEFSIIKGNISEIKALFAGEKNAGGVDAAQSDLTAAKDTQRVITLAKNFAKKTGAVVIITGETDIVTDGKKTYAAFNGTPMMSKVTGAGCMLGAIASAFAGANKPHLPEACLAAVCTLGVCGERAFSRLKENEGSASFAVNLIDELYNINSKILEENARYEIR
jgi:hydroxyethylthiazole kinase